MDIPANRLPDAFLWAGILCYASLVLVTVLTAPWSKAADNRVTASVPWIANLLLLTFVNFYPSVPFEIPL